MNSKLRNILADLLLDTSLPSEKAIEAENAIRRAVGEELEDELLTNIPNNINDYAEKVSQFIQRLKGGEDD